MADLPINLLDLIVLGVLVLSAVLAFARGFTREVFAVASWAAAGGATWALFQLNPVEPFWRAWVQPDDLADAIAGLVVFLIVLVIATLIARTIAHAIARSALGPLDRSLGFVFGLARGAFIACLAYLVMEHLMPAEERPPWIATAKSTPLLTKGSSWLLGFAPEEFREQAVEGVDSAAEEARKAAEAKKLFDELASPPPATQGDAGAEGDVGYKNADRKELERLFEVTP
ncbi:MAG: CvpA family protein [Alphaproteobacteria bacterium]|nr:CvpA family protein [Alphaproteobacteria bacterium]